MKKIGIATKQHGDKPTWQAFIFDCENGVWMRIASSRNGCFQAYETHNRHTHTSHKKHCGFVSSFLVYVWCAVDFLKLVITLSLLNCDVRSHRPKLIIFDQIRWYFCILHSHIYLHTHTHTPLICRSIYANDTLYNDSAVYLYASFGFHSIEW